MSRRQACISKKLGITGPCPSFAHIFVAFADESNKLRAQLDAYRQMLQKHESELMVHLQTLRAARRVADDRTEASTNLDSATSCDYVSDSGSESQLRNLEVRFNALNLEFEAEYQATARYSDQLRQQVERIFISQCCFQSICILPSFFYCLCILCVLGDRIAPTIGRSSCRIFFQGSAS